MSKHKTFLRMLGVHHQTVMSVLRIFHDSHPRKHLFPPGAQLQRDQGIQPEVYQRFLQLKQEIEQFPADLDREEVGCFGRLEERSVRSSTVQVQFQLLIGCCPSVAASAVGFVVVDWHATVSPLDRSVAGTVQGPCGAESDD